MNKVESVTFEDGVTLKYDGRLLKFNSDNVPDVLTVNDIRWAFVPPDLTDEEKATFVQYLNNTNPNPIDVCKQSNYYKELHGLPFEYPEEEMVERGKPGPGFLTEEDIKKLLNGLG